MSILHHLSSGLRHCVTGAALLLALSAFVATPAQAGLEGLYFSGKLGVTQQTLHDGNRGLSGEEDQTIALGGALGYDFYPVAAMPVRFEVEVMHQTEAKLDELDNKLKNTINTVFVNGYYDFHTGTIFTPYVGCGIGTAWVKAKGDVAGCGAGSNTESNFAWNLGAGLGIELTYNLSFDLSYRYAGFGTARTGESPNGVADGSVRSHQIMGGLRYTF